VVLRSVVGAPRTLTSRARPERGGMPQHLLARHADARGSRCAPNSARPTGFGVFGSPTAASSFQLHKSVLMDEDVLIDQRGDVPTRKRRKTPSPGASVRLAP
jgi:hypothetical protein